MTTATTTTVYGSVLVGLEPRRVPVVAIHGRRPRPGVTIVGLPNEAACREMQIRVRASLRECGYELSDLVLRVHDLPSGAVHGGLDLACAAAYLRAHVPWWTQDGETAYVGELALTGDVRPIRGALCHLQSPGRLVLPAANALEAGLSGHANAGHVHAVGHVRDLTCHPCTGHVPKRVGPQPLDRYRPAVDRLPAVHQAAYDRAVAHARVLLVGPPGAGKTTFARRLAASYELDSASAYTVIQIHSVAGTLREDGLGTRPPFRAPHHTCSRGAIVGDVGLRAYPGEVSLAHRGVLFLDELLEYRRDALDALVRVLRAGVTDGKMRYPAAPARIVAAVNPCSCGYRGSDRRRCACSPAALAAYDRRLDGEIARFGFERIDLPALRVEDLR